MNKRLANLFLLMTILEKLIKCKLNRRFSPFPTFDFRSKICLTISDAPKYWRKICGIKRIIRNFFPVRGCENERSRAWRSWRNALQPVNSLKR